MVTHFYDSVLLYANVVASGLQQGFNFRSGLQFTSAVANYTFSSPINGLAKFNADSDRLLDYEMSLFNDAKGKHEV